MYVIQRIIYALYSGKSYAKHDNDMRFSNDVFVFNWKGELVNRLKLDRETQTIAIDGDNYLL